jgi:hypothetical protein
MEIEQRRQMGEELTKLLNQVQALVSASIEQIDECSTPSSFSEALKQMDLHIQKMSQVLHQNN